MYILYMHPFVYTDVHEQQGKCSQELHDFNCTFCGHINTTGSSKIPETKCKLQLL